MVSQPPNVWMKVRYLICVRHLAISPMLHLTSEYFLVPSHFIVNLPIESFQIYKSKTRRSVSAPTKITLFPSQAMSRTEDTISISASLTCYQTVWPVDFRPSPNKSIKGCLFLVLDRNSFWDVELNSLARYTHTSEEITTFIDLLRCSCLLLMGHFDTHQK